jgi:peptidoglycan/xylan/chitin deacetylase (PgdA/CDA1 family)
LHRLSPRSQFTSYSAPTTEALPRLLSGRTLLVLSALLALAAGCHKKPSESDNIEPIKPKAPPQVSEVDLKAYKPNEAGAVMVLMYHRFRPEKEEKNNPLNRTPDTFRQDLEDLYKRKYYPVTASEFAENKMDVPAGKTPIVLTFDDSLPTQFKLTLGKDGGQHIDPDCAVGIMETFSKAHKDWPTKGTFFVLPHEGRNGDPFGDAESAAQKFDYLEKHGYEIANHTSTHPSMRHMSSDKIRWELATAVKDIRQVDKDAPMQILALPYGQIPGKAAQKDLISGESGGTKYENKAIFLAAWRPILSPVTIPSKKFAENGSLAVFNRYRLERITPDPNPKAGQTFEYWLKYFDEHPGQRYVSDGNLQVVAVPKSLQNMVDPKKVKAQGKVAQFYSFGGGKGGGAGSPLSVE